MLVRSLGSGSSLESPWDPLGTAGWIWGSFLSERCQWRCRMVSELPPLGYPTGDSADDRWPFFWRGF